MSVAVREPEVVVDDYVGQIIQAHEAVLRAGFDFIAAAVRAGQLLLEIKASHDFEEGSGWREWIETQMPFTYTTAHLYIRCAKHEPIIREQGWTHIREIKEGLGALVEPDHKAKGRTGKGKPEWMKDLARGMRGEGMSYRSIADELGVNPHSVRCWVDAAYERKHRQKVANINKRRIRAERALRDQERDDAIQRAVKKAGGAIAEAYAMAERMQDVIAQAQRETENTEARNELSEAGVFHRRMRDRIVRALGVTS